MVYDLISEIKKLGDELVKCNRKCDGIAVNRNNGILPRCLILKTEKVNQSGCAIIGINPGLSGPREQAYYKEAYKKKENLYKTEIDYWEKEISRRKYYKRLNELVGKFSDFGLILWTELVKCENADKEKQVPLQTFRCCTQQYLRREIKLLNTDWPLFAVGKRCYEALSFLYTEKTIIGIPHPTGSRGHFDKMNNKPLPVGLLKLLSGKAVWLPDII